MGVTILVLVGVNLLGYLAIYLLLKERIRRASSPRAQQAELREEVNRLMIELNQTTDRNISLLEDKIASLTELISKAEKTMTTLRREGEKREVGTLVYSRIVDSKVPSSPEPDQSRAEKRKSPEADRAPRKRTAPAPAAEEEALESGGDARDRVVALYKAGLTASLIAARVGVPLGEVELIIALAERRGG